MSEVLTSISSIILPLTIGGIGGFLVGHVIRKVFRLAMLIGILVFSLACMVFVNVINVNVNELVAAVSTFIATLSPFIIAPLTSSLLLMGSFIVGLLLGLVRH